MSKSYGFKPRKALQTSYTFDVTLSTMHFIGRVTMLFANNSLMECLITMKFLNIFLHPDVIFSSHTMLINASTKDFTPIHLVTFSI